MQLVDSDFYTRSDIDLLIGSDLFPTIMKIGIQSNLWGSLLGQETVFGWILGRPVFNISSHSTIIALEADQPYKITSTSSLWEAEELSKKPRTSTSKPTATTKYTGMLVVVWEDNLLSNEWILGTVETVRKTKMAKVAELRTKRGIIRRPILKLIIVPFD